MMQALESSTSDILKLLVALLTTGYTIYLLRDVTLEMSAQLIYEKSFMDKHPDIITRQQQENAEEETIPLTFMNQEIEHLKKLCKNYRSKSSPLYYFNLWSMRSREPSIETQHLRIRRLGRVPRPIKIEVIRCTTKYALIEAGDGATGYILKLDKANLNPDLTIFNIDAKFRYNQETPLQGTPHLSDMPTSQSQILNVTDV